VKRGLVVLDPAEVPDQEWDERIGGVRRAMAEHAVDVAFVYGDVSRSDDIAYLTNLCVYWNEGVLAVPAAGEPAFLTKLSPRVYPWMMRTSKVTDIRSGKNFAALIAAFLTDREAGTLGLIDAHLWPSDVVDEIVAAVPGWHVERLDGLVRRQRMSPSENELALLRAGARILDQAAGEALREGTTPGERVETVERALRVNGFLDLYPTSLSTSDGVTSFGVTGQYRTGWVHMSRLTGGDGWPGSLREALTEAISAAKAGVSVSDLDAAARPALAALPEDARAEVRWINEADLSTGGEFRGREEDARLELGAAGVVSVEVAFADGGHAAVAETVRITAGGPEYLTGATVPSGKASR
jgi:Xaa-Pro aminopeptidase